MCDILWPELKCTIICFDVKHINLLFLQSCISKMRNHVFSKNNLNAFLKYYPKLFSWLAAMFAFRIPPLRPSSKRLKFNREHWPSLSHRGKNFLKEKRVDYLLGDLWCISEREAIWPDKMQQQLQWGRKAAARHLDPFQFPPTQTDVKLFGKWKWQFLMMSWQLESKLFELERESGKFAMCNGWMDGWMDVP